MGGEQKVQVVIAEKHKLYRDGLRVLLADHADIEVVGEAQDARQVIEMIVRLKPDVVLIGAHLCQSEGIQIVGAIKEKGVDTKTILLAPVASEGIVFEAMKAGARGYIPGHAGASVLTKAIRTVHAGDLWIERKFLQRFFLEEPDTESPVNTGKKTAESDLTPREIEVLILLKKGYTNKEIAGVLYISEKTVKSHLGRIYRKLKVRQRLQAVLCAIRMGLC